MLGPQAQAVRRDRQSNGLVAHLEAHGVHSRSAERIERLHVRRQVGGMGIETHEVVLPLNQVHPRPLCARPGGSIGREPPLDAEAARRTLACVDRDGHWRMLHHKLRGLDGLNLSLIHI